MQTLSFLLIMVTLTRAAEAADEVKRGLLCPTGWTRYGWRCYRFVPSPMKWADAERRCKSMGARLASVHSADEYHWIQKMIADKTHDYPLAWLGATDSTQTGFWSWSDGSDFKFTHWCRGQPDKTGWQNCLQMNYSGRKCWDNLQCSRRRVSVCAKKI